MLPTKERRGCCFVMENAVSIIKIFNEDKKRSFWGIIFKHCVYNSFSFLWVLEYIDSMFTKFTAVLSKPCIIKFVYEL